MSKFWYNLDRDNYSKRERKNSQKKKKKADQEPVGAEMQGCPAQSGKFLIETENKMGKSGTLVLALHLFPRWEAGRLAKLGLLFDFDANVSLLKILSVGGQKASVARKWNEADVWGTEWRPASGFCVGEVAVGKPGGRNGVGEGSAQWNEPGYSCRAVQPGL